MTTIKIEGDGRTVEVSGDEPAHVLLSLAEATWHRLSPAAGWPRSGFSAGSAGQTIERANDRPVAGNGNYQSQPEPVTG